MRLSVELAKWRIDRPDEWKMDEFIRNAEKLEAERDAALAKLDGLGVLIHEAINGESAEVMACDGQITGYAISYDWLDKVDYIISETPTQHLRDRDAEVLLSAVEFFKPAMDVDIEALESYAEKVRKGES